MKIKDIKPKHLLLGEVFDDFAEATDKVDFSKEDLCSYIISLTNNFYWINTESVWGPIGFVWDSYDIDTKKGNGHFVTSNLGFNVIPKIPDSWRHTSLWGIFQNLNRNITFLDSGWGHLKKIESLDIRRSSSNIITCYFDSLTGTGCVIDNDSGRFGEEYQYNSKYLIYGDLDTCKTKAITLILNKEHKNKLNLDYSDNSTIYNFPITLQSIDENDTEFNIKDYFKLDTAHSSLRSSQYVMLDRSLFNNIDVLHYTAYIAQGYIYLFQFRYIPEKNYKEWIIDYHMDEINTYMPIRNEYGFGYYADYYTDKVTFKNLDWNKVISMDILYQNVRFDEVPDVTDIPIDRVSQLFRYCLFKGGYSHGSIPISKFYNCIIDFDVPTYPVYGFSDKGEFSERDLAIDYTNHINVEISESDITKNFYSNINLKGNPTPWLLFDIDYTPTMCRYSSNRVANKTKPVYTDSLYNIFVNNYKDSIIILNKISNYGGELYLRNVLFMTQDIKAEYIKFETDENNITDNKTSISTLTLSNKLYEYNGEKLVCIARNVTINNITRSKEIKLLLYNVGISYTSDELDNERVQYMLDNIITVGDIEDSKDKTITLLTSFYNNMKEETKERLLADGYNIKEYIP